MLSYHEAYNVIIRYIQSSTSVEHVSNSWTYKMFLLIKVKRNTGDNFLADKPLSSMQYNIWNKAISLYMISIYNRSLLGYMQFIAVCKRETFKHILP